MGFQFIGDFPYVVFRESIVLVQVGRAVRTPKLEHGFESFSDNVNMGWPVIVWINRHATSERCQYSRHFNIKPKRIRLSGKRENEILIFRMKEAVICWAKISRFPGKWRSLLLGVTDESRTEIPDPL